MFRFLGARYGNIVDLPDVFIGEGVTILTGPSGSGKTTVLKLLNKMISPTTGRITYRGRDLADLPSVDHRRKVSLLSQAPAIFEGSIRDNLSIALKFQEKEIPGEETLRSIMDRVRLEKTLDEPAHNLSGGEKQRLALGRLLLLSPEVYLLDEPASSLDDDTEELIVQMVLKHAAETARSVVMVTHSGNLARSHADALIEIADGRAAAPVTP